MSPYGFVLRISKITNSSGFRTVYHVFFFLVGCFFLLLFLNRSPRLMVVTGILVFPFALPEVTIVHQAAYNVSTCRLNFRLKYLQFSFLQHFLHMLPFESLTGIT